MKPDGGPAFPVLGKKVGDTECWADGMSLRDWFAGMALMHPYTRDGDLTPTHARWAYELADAMLAERGKP